MGDVKEEHKENDKKIKTEAALEICELAYKQYTRDRKKIWEPVWPGPTQSRRHPVRITLKMCGGQGCVIAGVPEDKEGRPEGFVWRTRYLPLRPVAPKPPERWSGWRLRKKRPKKKRGKRRKALDDIQELLGMKKGHYSKDSDDEEQKKGEDSVGMFSDQKKLQEAREETLREIYKKMKRRKKKSKKDKILEDEMFRGYLGRVCDITCLRKRIPRPPGKPVAGVTCQDVGTMTCLQGVAFSEPQEQEKDEKICSYRESETCRNKRNRKSMEDHLRHQSTSKVNFREEYGESNYYEPQEKQTYVFGGAKEEEEWDSSPKYQEMHGEYLECVPSVCPKYPRERGSYSAGRTREICAEPCRIQRGRSSELKSTPQKRLHREKTVCKARSQGEIKNAKLGKPCRTCQRESVSKRRVMLVKTPRQERTKQTRQICESCQKGRFESRRIQNVCSAHPLVCETCKRKLFESQRILAPPLICESCLRKRSPVKDFPVEELPVQDMPVQDMPVQDMPVQDMPRQDMPVQEMPVRELPVQEVPVQNVPVEELQVRTQNCENIVLPQICDTCQRKVFENQTNKIVVLKPPQFYMTCQRPRNECRSCRQKSKVRIECKERPPRELKPQKSIRLTLKGDVPCCTCPPPERPSRPPSARKRKHNKKKHRKVRAGGYHKDCVPPDKVNPYVDPTESTRSCRPC